MKFLFLCSLLAVTSLGLSSCCCLFTNNNRYESKETKLLGCKTVTKEVHVSGKSSKAGIFI